jgi:methyl-accepting chemotaxis protein
MMEGRRDDAIETLNQAAQAGTALEEITRVVADIRDMNVEIASAAEEQEAVSLEIEKNTASVGELSHENKQATSQTEETGSEIRAISNQISQLVERFEFAICLIAKLSATALSCRPRCNPVSTWEDKSPASTRSPSGGR